MRRWLLLGLMLLTTPAIAAAPARARWLLVISANVGGPETRPLRHAGDDALSVIEVMARHGGVTPDRVAWVPDPSASEVAAAFVKLDSQLRAARQQGIVPEVIVYYSGHADETGLRPNGDTVSWYELRRNVEDLDADVRIAILDACDSGAAVRSKGGTHGPGFLTDGGELVSGEAWITSSSGDEASQESDRLGHGYFTHHFLTGLSGAADQDDDDRVTLSEAYAWAYRQTVATTEGTWYGAQHPTYDFNLAGRGDVVLTDLRDRTASIVLDASLDGLVSVRDLGAGALLVAELTKEVGSPVEVALAPGRYELRLRAREHLYVGTVTVSGATPVTADDLVDTEVKVQTRTRGALPGRTLRRRPFAFHLAPVLGTYGLADDVALHGVSLDVLGARHGEVHGWTLGGASWSYGDVFGAQTEALLNHAGGDLRGAQLGAVSHTSGDVVGAQASLVNHVHGDLHGVQFGGANWADGAVHGAQLGGLFNVARGQSSEGVRAVQMGGVNVAADGLSGAQLGLVNHGGRVTGVQVGALNVANTMRGLQVGVINVGRHIDGETLGLLNFIGDGYHAIEVGTDETSPLTFGLKTGGRHLYTVLSVGFDPSSGPTRVSWGGGLGGHGQWKRFVFDGDVLLTAREHTTKTLFSEGLAGFDLRVRATPGLRLSDAITLYGGPSLGLALRIDGATPAPGGFVDGAVLADGRFRLWPGWQGGLRFTF